MSTIQREMLKDICMGMGTETPSSICEQAIRRFPRELQSNVRAALMRLISEGRVSVGPNWKLTITSGTRPDNATDG